MSAQAWDWLAVGLAVAVAAAWLGFRIRRTLRKPRESNGKPPPCGGSSCRGCPYGSDCDGRRD